MLVAAGLLPQLRNGLSRVTRASFLSVVLLGAFSAIGSAAADILTPDTDLTAAIESAPDGSVLRLADGRFVASFVLEGKTITLEGSGSGGTILEAPYGSRQPFTAGPGSRLVLRRIAMVPTTKLGPPVTEVMVGVAGGQLAAEDVRVEGAIGGLATVRVSGGSARFQRATITLTGTGTAVEGDDAAIELLATEVEAPFGTAVTFRRGRRLAIEGGKVSGGDGVTVEAGAPDVHLAAANVAATAGTALDFSAAGRLTIYGGQFLAEDHALILRGDPLQVGVEGVLFAAGTGSAATIQASLPGGGTASFVGSRFAARGEHGVGAAPTPAIRVEGSARVELTDNMVAASRGPALVLAGGAGADLRGNVFAGVSDPLVFDEPSAVRDATTEAEVIVSTGDAEPHGAAWPDLDPATKALAAALAENPDLGRRMREAASAAAQGSDAAFDELSLLADELRRSCETCP